MLTFDGQQVRTATEVSFAVKIYDNTGHIGDIIIKNAINLDMHFTPSAFCYFEISDLKEIYNFMNSMSARVSGNEVRLEPVRYVRSIELPIFLVKIRHITIGKIQAPSLSNKKATFVPVFENEKIYINEIERIIEYMEDMSEPKFKISWKKCGF